MCYCEQVKNGIRRTAHCDIQCHRIKESLACSDASRQYAFVAVLIIFISIFYDESRSVLEQLLAVFVSSDYSSVARKSQTDSLVQTVHGIGSKHTGAASASRTCMSFYLIYILVAHCRVGRLNHRINQVKMLSAPLSCFHRTA